MKTAANFIEELFESDLYDELENEGPLISNNCGGQPVRTALHIAKQYASFASQRLNQLSLLPDNQQEAQWNNNSPEKTWFGAYRKNRLTSLRNRMQRIVQTLEDPLLAIACNWNKSYFGKASPGIRDITLGKAWKDEPTTSVDKIQTLIHEVAHIRGAVLGGELRGKYGVRHAIDRAKRYPGVAIRTAENIGYYTVCRASIYSNCRP